MLRDAAGNLLTVTHRLSIKGDPVTPVIILDALQNQVSNLTALPVITNAIDLVAKTLTLTMTNPVLAGSALIVQVYSTVYIGA